MPKKKSGLTKTERGYCRTIGYYIHDGKRVPRKFRLGSDEAIERVMVVTVPSVADSSATTDLR